MRTTINDRKANEEVAIRGGAPASVSYDAIMGFLHAIPIEFAT